jgi:hypothetical protein
VARDAKLIGSTVGGVQVTIRNTATGGVLAEGLHKGGTGDTGLIMGAGERHASVFTTPGAASFTAELTLDAPQMITVEASGPLDFPQALTHASTTLLVVPGEDIGGDGVVLELWGYIVEVLDTPRQVAAGSQFTVHARVRLLCSCPTEPGGLWEAPPVTVRLTRSDGTIVAEAPLEYAGDDSMYQNTLTAPVAGEYRVEVIARSSSTGNAGRSTSTLTVR